MWKLAFFADVFSAGFTCCICSIGLIFVLACVLLATIKIAALFDSVIFRNKLFIKLFGLVFLLT